MSDSSRTPSPGSSTPPGYVAFATPARRSQTQTLTAILLVGVTESAIGATTGALLLFRVSVVQSVRAGTAPLEDILSADKHVRWSRLASMAASLCWMAAVIMLSKYMMDELGVQKSGIGSRNQRFKAALKAHPEAWKRYRIWLGWNLGGLAIFLLLRFALPTSNGGTMAQFTRASQRSAVFSFVGAALTLVIAVSGWKSAKAIAEVVATLPQ
jgi:hypothetical protein